MLKKFLFGLLLVVTAAASALVVDAAAGDPRLLPALKNRPPATAARPKLTPQQLYLVRATLAALGDANRTGNYSVLRDLAAPAFQARHSAADLALAFADLRRRAADLSVVLLAEPDTASATDADGGLLRLTGTFTSPGQALRFKLDFAPIAGHWRLSGLSVDVQAVSAAT